MYQVPKGCRLVNVGERFIAEDSGRWFIMQNYDYEDREGYMGMSTKYLGNTNGYETEEDAEKALAGID